MTTEIQPTEPTPMTTDELETWIASMAMGYPRMMVQDQDCCPGAADMVHEDVGKLVREVMRLRNENNIFKEEFSNVYRIIKSFVYTAELPEIAKSGLISAAKTWLKEYEDKYPTGAQS